MSPTPKLPPPPPPAVRLPPLPASASYGRPRGRGRIAVYTAVWMLLATLALGYMALLVVRPDLAGSLILRPETGAPENNFGQRAMTRALAELNELKGTVAGHDAEMGSLRSQLATGAQRMAALETRVAQLEVAQPAATAPVAQATPASATPTPPAATPPAQPQVGELVWGATVEGTIVDKTGKQRRREPQAGPSTMTAGAGPAPKAADAKASAKRPTGMVAVMVGSGASLDAVRLSWQLLVDANTGELAALEPRYIEQKSGAAPYHLIAGPVASREEAAKICEQLKARRARCSIAPFGGEPL